MRVAGIGVGDRVITSPNTFIASANAAAYVGGTPDFSDIDPVSYNLDPDTLGKNWRADTKAVVAVDYAGQPCDMPAIAKIARANDAIVIEDACHGVGGGFEFEGSRWKLGGHPWADMTIFSFHPVNTMTTGEGGMLVTESEDWNRQARKLRSHGMERSQFTGLGHPNDPGLAEQGPWYYEMQELGYNYRLSDLQCALGISQLERLTTFMEKRRRIVAQYNEAFTGLSWLTPPGLRSHQDADRISWHLYTVQIDFELIRKTRTEVMKELKAKGVGTQVLYIPVHLQPWYRKTYGYSHGKCPHAEAYYRRTLSLPLYPAMSASDVRRVIDTVRNIHV